jgi:hypothetical protein
MNKEWYYVENGMKNGPVSIDRLKGKISKETLVWCEGMTDWINASQINEFKSFFKVTPPPIPGVEIIQERKEKYLSRISDSILYAWIFVALSVLACILEYTGNDKGRIYGLVMFLSLTSLIRVFLGLRAYFLKILQNKSLGGNVGWLIMTIIPLYVFMALDSRHSINDRFSEEILFGIYLVLLLATILNIYHNVRMAQKLPKMNGVGILEFKKYAIYQLLTFPSLILLILIFGVDDSPVILETLLELIPVYFLIIGLQQVRDKYVPQVSL